MQKQYNFLSESIIQKWKAYFKDPNALGRFMTRTAAGGLVGGTVGGVVGVIYGVKVYESKDKTLENIEKKILDPETSDYKRRQLVDTKNMILSMSDEEYRNFLLMKFYRQGKALGATIGSLGGSMM